MSLAPSRLGVALVVLLAIGSAATFASSASAAAQADDTVLLHTVQTRPIEVRAKVGSVVGQAGVTRGGKLVLRLASPNEAGVAGENVLAQTTRTIKGLISNLRRAKVRMKLDRDGTGAVTVIGPKNAQQPDSVLTEFVWKVGKRPAIRIVAE
jgi:hypothetical protein